MEGIRVGILGAANIAWQHWGSIHKVGGRVTCVGCRDAERGKAFVDGICNELHIDEADRPKVVSYDDVVSSPDVDVVFIPIPVTARDSWVRKCADHGKHVVGEKPCATDAGQLREWIECLDAKQLLYMDGTMFSHGARIAKLVEAVNKAGGAKRITSNFTIPVDDKFLTSDIRMDPGLEPHGALGDVGWYNIRATLQLMNYDMPVQVTGRIIKQSEKGAIIEFSGELFFQAEDGTQTSASMFCGFGPAVEQTLRIATKTALIEVVDFVHPIGNKVASWVEEHYTCCNNDGHGGSYNTVKAEVHESPDDIETRTQRDAMWSDVGSLLTKDEKTGQLVAKQEARFWAVVSWKTQSVMDKMLECARLVPTTTR